MGIMAEQREGRRTSSLREQEADQIQNRATYRQSFLALLNGKPVRVIATGDLPGHSPVCQYVDEQGRIDWDEEVKFSVIDPNLVPPNSETLQRITRQFTDR